MSQESVVNDVALSMTVATVKNYPRLDKSNADMKGLERLAREVGVEQGKRRRSNSMTGMRTTMQKVRAAACCLCHRCAGEGAEEDANLEEEVQTAERSSLLRQPSTSYDGEPREPKIEDFVRCFEHEVNKVASTHKRELAKLESRLREAEERCKEMGGKSVARRDAFALEFTEIYRLAHYLSAYTIRNYSTLLALLEVRDIADSRWRARNNRLLGPLLREEVLEKAAFARAERVEELLNHIVDVCADNLHDGNHQLASFALLSKKRQTVDWNLVLVGTWCGFALGMSCWTMYVVVFDSVMQTEAFQKSDGLRIYRGLGAILLFAWGGAIQIAAWRESRINFPVIFSISSQAFPATRQLFRWAAIASVVYLINLIVFVKELRRIGNEKTAGLFPLLLLIVFIVGACAIWNHLIFMPQARQRGLRGALKLCFVSVGLFVVGLSEGGFLTAYISDYLTSSTKVLVDFAYIGCSFVVSGPTHFVENLTRDSEVCRDSFAMTRVIVPIITCWPLWLRLGQNLSRLASTGKEWPFLVNAMKYGFSHTIVIFSAMKPELLDLDDDTSEVPITYRVAFVAIFALTSLLMFSWDVGMDWGLGRPQHKFLRKRLMLASMWHGSRIPYYFFIALDFFLRYLWTVTLLPSMTLGKTWIFSTTPLVMFEVIRRTMWGLIRVENEHLSNTRGYRSSSYIPLYFSTWQESNSMASANGSGEKGHDADEEREVEHESWFGPTLEVVCFVALVAGLAVIAIIL